MKKSRVIAALGALAQETRLDIFRLLVQQGPEGLPAGEIGTRNERAAREAFPPTHEMGNQVRVAALPRRRFYLCNRFRMQFEDSYLAGYVLKGSSKLLFLYGGGGEFVAIAAAA
jgi:hypothetical protein